MKCNTFSIKRACFIGKMSSINPHFVEMSNTDKLKTILCPSTPAAVKIVNEFIRIMFLARDKLSEGLSLTELSYPSLPANIYPCTTNYDSFSEWDEWEESFTNLNFSDIDD